MPELSDTQKELSAKQTAKILIATTLVRTLELIRVHETRDGGDPDILDAIDNELKRQQSTLNYCYKCLKGMGIDVQPQQDIGETE